MQRYSNEVTLTSVLERGLRAVATQPAVKRRRSSSHRLRDKLSPAAQLAIVRGRVEDGDSLQVLSERHGVSDYSIRLVLLQAGVALGKPRVSAEQQTQIQELHQSGASLEEIARRTGVSNTSVTLVLAALQARRGS